MDIVGIRDGRAYYLYNPILVEIEDIDGNLILWVNVNDPARVAGVYRFDLYPDSNGKVRIDLAKIILGVIGEVESMKELPQNNEYEGVYAISLDGTDGNHSQQFGSYYFVLGGEKDYVKNVEVLTDLYDVLAIWGNYPYGKFEFSNGVISAVPYQPAPGEVERVRAECDNIYIFFRNHLGGFSGYLFEDHTIAESGNHAGYYLTYNNIVDAGSDVKLTIKARSKVKRKHYPLIQDLATSKEIYRYLEDSQTYQRIYGANFVELNNKAGVTEVEMDWGIIHTYDAQW